MKDGFVKVATVTCKVKVADVENNCKCICDYMDEAAAQGIKVTVFPELCITGYTCQDLFFQDKITEASKEALIAIAKHIFSKHFRCGNTADRYRQRNQ